MTVKRLIPAIISAIFLMAGCSMRHDVDNAPEEGYYEFRLEASAASDAPESRTAYEDDKIFSWSNGDRISVLFHKGSDNKFFTLSTQTVNGATATFSGMIESGYEPGAAGTGAHWALYPEAEHSFDGDFPTFNMPGTFDYASDHFYALVPMYAQSEDGRSFAFKRLCGTYKFSFTGITSSKVRFVVENQNTHQLSGSFPIKKSSYNDIYTDQNWCAAGSDERKLTFIENVTSGQAVFYVPFRAWESTFKPILSLYDADSGSQLFSKTAKSDFSGYSSSISKIIVLPPFQLGDIPPSEATMVTYTESSSIFANPERGFYKAQEYRKASASVLSSSTLASLRASGRSLMLLEYYLTDFISSDISSAYLTLIEKNFKALRSGGVKCVLRFAYKDNHSSSDHPWDATEAWVMRHIEQLTPLFTTYKDVIFVLQAGFIGSWGEWYYTDNFVMSPSTTADYAPRGRVLDALLNAMPSDRQVQVRTPKFKMKLVGSTPLTATTAHNGSKAARVGAHNDCFVASGSDQGTFNSDTERNFWAADTRYTIMGGETCAVSDQCHCEAFGSNPGTLSELKKYHWTYLHDGYRQEVLDLWKSEGCFDQIDRELGYRLVLEDGSFGAARAGQAMQVTLHLRNKGYAAPMNPRTAYLVLTSESGSELGRWSIGSDPRFWGPDDGQITIDQSITLPASASGTVKLYLYMPDPEPTLASDARFAIRCANENVWDGNTGLNLLYSFSL